MSDRNAAVSRSSWAVDIWSADCLLADPAMNAGELGCQSRVSVRREQQVVDDGDQRCRDTHDPIPAPVWRRWNIAVQFSRVLPHLGPIGPNLRMVRDRVRQRCGWFDPTADVARRCP